MSCFYIHLRKCAAGVVSVVFINDKPDMEALQCLPP